MTAILELILIKNSFADFIINKEDNHRLPFDDCEFDYVISRYVFEHIDNLEILLAEISRILKPGGILRFSVPHVWSIDAYDDPTHLNFFTIRSMCWFCRDQAPNVVYVKNYFKNYSVYLRVTLGWPRLFFIRIPISFILATISLLFPKMSEYLLKLPFTSAALFFEVKK